MKNLQFSESSEDGNGKLITVSKEDAIKHQRLASVYTKGVDLYDSDDDALFDFMVINWAWEVE